MDVGSHTYRCTYCGEREVTDDSYGTTCHSIATVCSVCDGLRDFVDVSDTDFWEKNRVDGVSEEELF